MITRIKLKAGFHIGRMENASYFELQRELDLNERCYNSFAAGRISSADTSEANPNKDFSKMITACFVSRPELFSTVFAQLGESTFHVVMNINPAVRIFMTFGLTKVVSDAN